MAAGEQGLGPDLSAVRQYHRQPGPHGAHPGPERTIAPDDGCVADLHAGDVGDRVLAPRPPVPNPDAQVTRPQGVASGSEAVSRPDGSSWSSATGSSITQWLASRPRRQAK